MALYGGKPIRSQIEKLERGAEIVVGTPGRVLDHLGRGTLKLDNLGMVVLDEADRMLDIGFRPDIEKILRRCPCRRQTLLFSATVPPPVERLARSYMTDPETLNFSPTDISVETIDQYYCTVDAGAKIRLLERLLKQEDHAGDRLLPHQARDRQSSSPPDASDSRKWPASTAILPQKVRDRVMAAFREGKVKVLVATDVVGRGIDVTGISHIINYDIPRSATITSIASAAPAAWDARGWPIPSSRPKKGRTAHRDAH